MNFVRELLRRRGGSLYTRNLCNEEFSPVPGTEPSAPLVQTQENAEVLIPSRLSL